MGLRTIAEGIGQTGKSVVSRQSTQLGINLVSFLNLRPRLQGLQRKGEKTP